MEPTSPSNSWRILKKSEVIRLALACSLVLAVLVFARLSLKAYFVDWDGASQDGWVGRSKTSLEFWLPPADQACAVDGYEQSWSHYRGWDSSFLVAVKFDSKGKVVASDAFLVNDDDPEAVQVTPYRPE